MCDGPNRIWQFLLYRVPGSKFGPAHVLAAGGWGRKWSQKTGGWCGPENLRPQAGPQTFGAPPRRPPAASRSLPVSIYSSARVPRTPAHIPRTPAAAANAFAVASRSSARPTRPQGPGERGWHGCRGGRRRWDGRRPEAPHVRRRVSPLSFPDSFLPLLLAPPPRSACPPPVPVTRIDICSISLAPGGGAFVRGCTAACSAGSRGDRNAGTVWVTEAVQYDWLCASDILYHVLVSPSHLFDALFRPILVLWG